MQDNGYDEEGHETRDRRADTRTTFYERDIDNLNVSQRRKRRLKRALRYQEGEQVNAEDYDSRGQQNHKEDKRRMIGSFGSQLELTGAQKERVKHLVMDVISVNSFGSYSSEQVVLAVINVVAREDGRWIEDEEQFRRFMENVGVDDLDTMKSLRGLVRDRIPSK
jgi:hypothetical protein